MADSFNTTLAKAIRKLLRPLVRILLRYDVPYGVLADLVRSAYVDVAWHELLPKDRKQTISHVSALTGLTRKEVKRLVDAGAGGRIPDQARYSRAIRVISGWSHDRTFQESAGNPAVLPFDGGQQSFSLLVRKYSGDIPVRAMLNTLLEAGSVSVTNDQVSLVRKAYVPGQEVTEKIEILGRDVAELVSTIEHNLVAPPDDLRFQRKVTYDNIDPDAVARLRKLSAGKAQALLELLDRQFSKHDLDHKGRQDGKSISVGIYYHEQDPNEEKLQ
jgi:Family of unknown function (DUF6502)